MERRLSGVDTSLGGVEQALFELEAATNFAGTFNEPALRLPAARACVL